jgi:hypothetical protein
MQVHSETQKYILALLATSFGHYGHQQANAMQEF